MPLILVTVWLLCAASVAISLLAIYSLAAAWAARPAGHWFFRAVALLLFCGAWLFVPEYRIWLFCVTLSLGMLLMLRCDAIESDLDAMRIGQAITSGGLLLDHLVGGAYELSGLDGLRQLIDRLDDGDCVRLSESLRPLLTVHRESFDDVAWRERRHNALTRPWPERLVLLQLGKMWDAERQVFDDQTKRTVCSGRLLLTHIALRRFRLANAVYPARLDELVPNYLDVVPIDSFSGRSLIYRRLENRYQLYSVGPDGKDDDGTSTSGAAPAAPADLLFDVEFEPD